MDEHDTKELEAFLAEATAESRHETAPVSPQKHPPTLASLPVDSVGVVLGPDGQTSIMGLRPFILHLEITKDVCYVQAVVAESCTVGRPDVLRVPPVPAFLDRSVSPPTVSVLVLGTVDADVHVLLQHVDSAGSWAVGAGTLSMADLVRTSRGSISCGDNGSFEVHLLRIERLAGPEGGVGTIETTLGLKVHELPLLSDEQKVATTNASPSASADNGTCREPCADYHANPDPNMQGVLIPCDTLVTESAVARVAKLKADADAFVRGAREGLPSEIQSHAFNDALSLSSILLDLVAPFIGDDMRATAFASPVVYPIQRLLGKDAVAEPTAPFVRLVSTETIWAALRGRWIDATGRRHEELSGLELLFLPRLLDKDENCFVVLLGEHAYAAIDLMDFDGRVPFVCAHADQSLPVKPYDIEGLQWVQDREDTEIRDDPDRGLFLRMEARAFPLVHAHNH